MQPTVALIAGLGNPGERYERTRHNAGFWLVDDLARALGTQFRAERRFGAEIASGRLGDHPLHLVKPQTFMNRSGQAIGAWARYYQVPCSRMLVVHDEIDLPPGVARLKRGGGPGGHNGLRDIIAAFGGDQDFARLRIGVGRPEPGGGAVVDYVLKAPPADERLLIDGAIARAIEVLPLVVAGEIERAMNLLHTDNLRTSGPD